MVRASLHAESRSRTLPEALGRCDLRFTEPDGSPGVARMNQLRNQRGGSGRHSFRLSRPRHDAIRQGMATGLACTSVSDGLDDHRGSKSVPQSCARGGWNLNKAQRRKNTRPHRRRGEGGRGGRGGTGEWKLACRRELCFVPRVSAPCALQSACAQRQGLTKRNWAMEWRSLPVLRYRVLPLDLFMGEAVRAAVLRPQCSNRARLHRARGLETVRERQSQDLRTRQGQGARSAARTAVDGDYDVKSHVLLLKAALAFSFRK